MNSTRGKFIFPVVGVIAGLSAFTMLSFLWPSGFAISHVSQGATPTIAQPSDLGPAVPAVRELKIGSRDGGMSVSWAAPIGAQAVSHMVQAVPADTKLESRTCTTKALSCVINGLTNGVAYAIEVRSVDAEGAMSAPQRGQATPHPGILASTSSQLW